MTETDVDKPYAASPFKLQKARGRGSVSKSLDLTFAAIVFSCTCIVFGMGSTLVQGLATFTRELLSHASLRSDGPAVYELLRMAVIHCMYLLAMPVSLIVLVAICANALQVGFAVSAEPLKPDFNRLSPTEAFRKILSIRSAYEVLKSLAKIGIIALAFFAMSTGLVKEILLLPYRQVSGVARFLVEQVGFTLSVLTVILTLLALVDLAYTRWEFLKRMRMSKRELNDEFKHREGDPRIKARLRELRNEWAKKFSSVRRVKDSDVLVTNPTHYAVAIAYRRAEMPAPKILAKGTGQMALLMRHLAARNGVSIVERPLLARNLYKSVGLDDYLPQQHYSEIAKILVWVFSVRHRSGPSIR
jgi:flagellar biosynthetic protein FlhB